MIPPLLALFSWPVVSLVLFQNYRIQIAILATLLGGYLLLPENTVIDLPLLPALDKHSIPVITAFALVFIFGSKRAELSGLLPRHWIVRLCLAAMILGAFATVFNNRVDQVYGTRVLEGLRLYDGFSAGLVLIITLLPVILARRYLATPQAHRLILIALCIAGLLYSLPALFEVRISPQLNRWVYGFFPHEWRQHLREGGFRPVVFLKHGLLLSMFFACTLIAVAALARIDLQRRSQYLFALGWLALTLVLSKSLGALIISTVLVPVVLMLAPRTQLLIASIIGLLVLSYPMVRASQVLPLDSVEQTVARFSEDRAGSLRTRLDNEEAMLEKALQKPLFGWGGWGRSRVFDNQGRDLTIADGYWIITFGIGGWVRYLAEFAIFVMPLVLLWHHAQRYRVGPETAALGMIMAGNLIDLIPNSSMTVLTLLLAGALWGRLELGAQADTAERQNPNDPVPKGYSRYGGTVKPTAVSLEQAPVNIYTRQTQRIIRRASSKD